MLFELTQLGEVKKGVRFIHCVDCSLAHRDPTHSIWRAGYASEDNLADRLNTSDVHNTPICRMSKLPEALPHKKGRTDL